MSDAGRSPRTPAELIRDHEQRLTRLERSGTTRIGPWVIGQDPVSGKIAATSPDQTVVLTPDPPPKADVTAGIMPGLFAAWRSPASGHNALAGYHPFAADWYDQVETTSDRMVFDSATNTVRVESTALLAVKVQQGVVSGQLGSRHYRPTLSLSYDEAEDPTLIRAGINARYDGGEELIFGDTFLVPVQAGALLTPGYWCSDSPLGALTGDSAGLLTRFAIVRVLDL